MQDIAELESRITAALERIGKGLDSLGSPSAASIDALQSALEDERIANAQLTERLRAVKDRDARTIGALTADVERMTRQLDVQGLELQRMRQTTIQLREHLRTLREAQAEGLAEPGQLNKAMLAELDALRAARSTELAEMDEILAELAPLLAAPRNEEPAHA